ncbi:MAG: hypothetical protein KC635_03555 [Myxococcales bacterium]|nr:hypothetical protein [Myxococcales bacterium]
MNHILRLLALGVALAAAAGCSSDAATGDLAAVDADASLAIDTTPAPDTAPAPDTVAPPDTADTADTAADDTGDDAGPDTVDATDDTAEPADTTPPTIAARCFPALASDDPSDPSPDYDQFPNLVAGSHCLGTNHQAITGVEKVVFLGDSVTVGTPNEQHLLSIDNSHFYRNLLAEWLATRFDLDRGEPVVSWGLWKAYDYVTGKGGLRESGDFRDCAKWGARTDDLLDGGHQIPDCFPDGGSDATTLVVFTMGGNDIAAITQKGGEASDEEADAGYPSVWALAESTVAYLEEAILWLKSPERFPNGSYVVFANPYEFTDSTGDTDACTPQDELVIPGIGSFDLSGLDIAVASLAGYKPWKYPAQQAAMVVWILNEYARVAADHQVDLLWMLEHFCGHGYVATGPDADPANRCYQGPDAELWFDVSCIHPNEAGHRAIFEMFKAVIEE